MTAGLLLLAAVAAGADWPQYRADAARSAYVKDAMPATLSLQWACNSPHRPAPAWLGEDTRMPFDRAFQPVVAGGLLCFGSSVDGKIYGLDAATGAVRWSAFTGGPVRFAPALWQDRVFAASDDGRLHCLSARDGSMLWQLRGGPSDSLVLGNSRLISRWPARGGPVVRDGVVYFAAGIWPSEGIYLYAVDAASGKVLWRNDDSGGMEMSQPHPGARAKSGIAPQGYLAATEKQLFVPNGRGIPAAFDRADGKFQFFHLQTYGKPTGGSGVLAAEDHFFNGGRIFDAATGMASGMAPLAELVAAGPDRVVFAGGGQLSFNRWVEEEVVERKGATRKVKMLRPAPSAPGMRRKAAQGRIGEALSLAGDEYVETPEFGFDYNRITIAAWIKPDSAEGRMTIFDNRNVKDCPGIEIRNVSGVGAKRVSVITPGVFAAETRDGLVEAGQWVHIAYTRNGAGNTHKIYINGVEQALITARSEPYASTPTPKDIGRRGNGKQNFQGLIDELAVYDRALSAGEIARLAKATAIEKAEVKDGLVLSMPMERGQGTEDAQVADASGKGHHGTLFTRGTMITSSDVSSIIMVGGRIVIGGAGRVCVLPAAQEGNGATTWTAKVDGTVYGLAFANGRLYASTDQGAIYCFGAAQSAQPAERRPATNDAPYGDNAVYARAAEEIIRRTGVTEGYAADLGCGDGALAYELAKRTRLRIEAFESDPERVRQAREKLDAAGLYGSRVTVHLAGSAYADLPNSFADLVVSGRAAAEGAAAVPEAAALRLRRPWGGVACFGKPGAMSISVRGALAGAGTWTHQYADAANTAVSSDTLVKSPLAMLWFRDYDAIDLASRHGRPPAPLFSAGRIFMMGTNGIYSVDAYNGRFLWQLPVPNLLTSYDQEHLMGTAITGGGFCLEGENIYARARGRCLRIDAATGKQLAEFPLPGQTPAKDYDWGILAVERGILFGSLARRDHVVRWAFKESGMEDQLSESSVLFALDARSGQERWRYPASQSVRHNAVAIGGGRVYLIDRPRDTNDLLSTEAEARGRNSWSALKKKGEPVQPQAPGTLIALDAATGKLIWRVNENIYGTMLALSLEHDILLMSYQHNHAFRLPSELGGRMAAFRASDGKLLWDVEADYAERPILNGSTIFAQPGAWDLLTGKRKEEFTLTRSYGCGTVAGSRNLLAFRSAVLGFRDLTRADSQTENYGGIRPGCWINAIPAGGLLLMPDATASCTCGYLNKAFIALEPVGR